jgi:hypothetical protein
MALSMAMRYRCVKKREAGLVVGEVARVYVCCEVVLALCGYARSMAMVVAG